MNKDELTKANELVEKIKTLKKSIEKVELCADTRYDPHYAFKIGNAEFRANKDDRPHDSRFNEYAKDIGGQAYRDICEAARILLLHKLQAALKQAEAQFEKM